MSVRNRERDHDQLNLLPQHANDAEESNWDFSGEDTQYLTHGLHPYLAAMIPQIPRRLLAKYSAAGTRVLDPFVGGGAVLVESYLANVESTGIDVNPLAIIISRAKTTPIPCDILMHALQNFQQIHRAVEPLQPTFPKSARIEYWFKSYMFEQLGKIVAAIDAIVAECGQHYQEKLRNLLFCIFSATVRAVSLTYRGEVRLRRLQGKDLERFNPDVLREFTKRMADGFDRVARLPRNHKPPCLYEGDARRIPREDGYFNLVITSPPYGDIKNTIPYHQFSKNMIYWLGLGEPAVTRIKLGSLGAKMDSKERPNSETLTRVLARMQKPDLKQEASCFYHDYEAALAEVSRVTSQRIVIVIGHRILDGILFDNASITTEILAGLGWNLEAKMERSIRRKRLNRKMGFGHKAQGATIDTESILIYVSPR